MTPMKTVDDLWNEYTADSNYADLGIEFVPVEHLRDVFAQAVIRTLADTLRCIMTSSPADLERELLRVGDICGNAILARTAISMTALAKRDGRKLN